jgi:MFS family permease
MKKIPKAVILLGLVSLFTDASTEMFFPILPIFLSQVLGAGPAALGIIEGVAESTASLLKVFSGFWADRLSRRKPLVVLGYSLSSFFRPFIGLAATWPVVLVLRFIDRMGKGIRSSPRDALIADITTPENRGASFGLHQAMDHAGAVIGPLITYVLLSSYFGLTMRQVILYSAVPAFLAWTTLVFGVKEEASTRVPIQGKKLELVKDWKKFGPNFKFLLLALLVFTLGCSTDAFLLVRLSQVGVATSGIALLWAVFHVVKMTASVIGGRLSDAWGRKPVILSGWTYYAVIYACFALVTERDMLIVVFLAYGVYYGLSEPVEKAYVADLAPTSLRGTAFGYYNLMMGLGAAPASILFGWVGDRWGYPSAFAMGAAFAAVASVLLYFVKTVKTHPVSPAVTGNTE